MYRRCSCWFLLALAAGCGSVKDSHLADAPGPSLDSGGVIRGTVRVTVLDAGGTGAPAVGANVVFLDPDGSLVKRVATDTAGKANADVLPGGSVTSIALVSTQYQLQTVLGVKPGDDIVLGNKNGDGSVAGDFTITYPLFGGATSYSVVSPCGTIPFPAPATGGPPAPAKISISNSCKRDPMELVVVAQGANGPLSSIAKAGVPFVPGGSTTITGSYQGLRSVTVSYTNINPIITNLDMNRLIPDGFGFDSNQTMASPGTSLTMTVTGPQAAGGQIFTQASGAAGQFQTVRQAIPGTAATYGLDVAATLLPWINSPTYDPATRKLVVPLDTTGTSSAKPDIFAIGARYGRVDANNVSTTFTWTLFGPEAADIVLPALPADLAAIGPGATDTVTIFAAAMFEADSVSGYDAIRNDPNHALELYAGARPPAATVRTSRAPAKRGAL
ncbi:MAG TPA: carboxypeptidase-like regulatory domain-containing protein [Kofleriaceae bacterium]